MTDLKDGANWAPHCETKKVVKPGEFCFAAAFLEHGHIYGQCNGLIDAGATLKYVYEPDTEKRQAFLSRYPQAQAVEHFDLLLQDRGIKLICAAAIPNERANIGKQVLRSGKDYFTDKSPFTNLAQLTSIEKIIQETGQKYAVYYSERLHNDAAWRAGELIQEGAIGRVLHVTILAPHRLAKSTRPDWFFDKERYGGIITDIGSHQVEQFLNYSTCQYAEINFARTENFNNPDKPGLEDFGEFNLTGNNGAGLYSRVDWYTPEGLRTWGDGRTFIVGTEGSIEVRKYLDICGEAPASDIYLCNTEGESKIHCLNQTGFPFFGRFILDCMHRTENAMTQAHTLRVAEISLRAQVIADQQRGQTS